MTLDLLKPIQQRDGTEVRIYSIHAGQQYPIHGAYRWACGEWHCAEWMADGKFNKNEREESFMDLVNVEVEKAEEVAA